MSQIPDPVQLTQELIRLDTINPQGNEEPAARLLGDLLAAAGLEIAYPRLGENRCGLVATLRGAAEGKPLIYTGHLDTVPLGNAPWSVEPHSADIKDGKLWGRGASDMKSGVAGIAVAALRLAQQRPGRGDLVFAFTAGEETGSDGAFQMVASGSLPQAAGAMVVAEPSGNQPFLGHKGAFWLKCTATGKSAHGSMPHLGDNAIYKAARAAAALEGFFARAEAHPQLGPPTVNVGVFEGGSKINMVPDRATFQVDLRTVPGVDHAPLLERIKAQLGPDITVDVMLDLPSVLTAEDDPWIGGCIDILAEMQGERPAPGYVNFFTDASVFTPALGNLPTLILGPGEAGQAHQTDEFCLVEKIAPATEAYVRIGRRWWDR